MIPEIDITAAQIIYGLAVVIISAIVGPSISLLLQKFFSKNSDSADYAKDLMDVTKSAAAETKQARQDLDSERSESRKRDEEHQKQITALDEKYKTEIQKLKETHLHELNEIKKRMQDMENIQNGTLDLNIRITPFPNPQVVSASIAATQKS